MALPPVLLPEIVDQITEFLQHDKIALSRCSLVSHLWHHSSSRHLFRSVQLCDPPPGFPREPLDALYIFLKDNPRIRVLVHELRLTSADGLFKVGISIGRLQSMVTILPSLRALIVGSLQFWELEEGTDDLYTIDNSTRRFKLRHLSLSASFCLSIHPTFLSRTLALFDEIDELQLQSLLVTPVPMRRGPHRFTTPASRELKAAPGATPPAIKALTLGRFTPVGRVLSLLPTLVDMGSLTSLRVTRLPEHNIPVVDALICTAAARLQEISLFCHRFTSSNLAYAIAQTEQTGLPSLQICTALESISLGVEIHLDYDLSEINQVYWRRCLELFANTQPFVRRVTISVVTWAVTGTSYFEPLASLEWALLDRYVARYEKLESLRVNVSSRSVAPWIVEIEEMRAQLVDKFSVRNRELVEISFGDP